MSLANKILIEQLLPIIRVYVQWYAMDDHRKNITFDQNFTFSTDPGDRRDETFVNFDYTEGDVTHRIRSVHAHGDCYDVEFIYGKPMYSFSEGQEIVGKLIRELYLQIDKWAVDNKIPPENMMY